MKIWLFIMTFGLAFPACSQNEQKRMELTPERRLLTAVTQNNVKAVKEALLAGADKEVRDSEGRSPLMLATYGNHIEIARILIEAGANVNAQDKILNSPFLYAGAEGYTDIVEMSMKSGADYGVFNRFNGTALIPACERAHVDVVTLLVSDKNFPIDHINRLGWTGLLEAIILGNGGAAHVKVVKLLIGAGSDVNIADKDGISPLAHAKRKRQHEIVQLLEQAGGR